MICVSGNLLFPIERSPLPLYFARKPLLSHGPILRDGYNQRSDSRYGRRRVDDGPWLPGGRQRFPAIRRAGAVVGQRRVSGGIYLSRTRDGDL